jgi:hypothetical protein
LGGIAENNKLINKKARAHINILSFKAYGLHRWWDWKYALALSYP